MRVDWHLPMDAHEWTLLPHHELITALEDWVKAADAVHTSTYASKKRQPISQVTILNS